MCAVRGREREKAWETGLEKERRVECVEACAGRGLAWRECVRRCVSVGHACACCRMRTWRGVWVYVVCVCMCLCDACVRVACMRVQGERARSVCVCRERECAVCVWQRERVCVLCA